jgi:transposase
MEIAVGIDVSKMGLDVHIHPLGLSFAVDNNEAGVKLLVERLAGVEAKWIGMEATGGLERLAASMLGHSTCRWWSSTRSRYVAMRWRWGSGPRRI